MDNNLNNDKEKDEYTFIRETIKEKPPLVLRILLRIVQGLGMGIIFGLGVCLVLFAFDRDIRDYFRDDNETITVTEEHNEKEQDTTMSGSSEEVVNLEDSINSKLVSISVIFYEDEQEESTGIGDGESQTVGISDDKEINTQANSDTTTEISSEEIETTTGDEDTKKRKIEKKLNYTGVIISGRSDIYVWLSYDKVKDGDLIIVTFIDGTQAEASVYGVEELSGVAMLQVAKKDLTNETRALINEAELLEIEELSSGDKLIYAGNPYGGVRLFYTGTLAGLDTGIINYDMYYRGVITDISNSGIEDGFLFSEDGKLVAMVAPLEIEQAAANNLSGVCMGDLKTVVNALLYKYPINHMGIKGECVTEDMRELTQENMPDGLYVTDVARDSTSYKSGIMVGDIIISANGTEIKGLKDIRNILDRTAATETLTVVLMRKIGTGYNQFTIKVPIEAY